jgi:hypothetical protein
METVSIGSLFEADEDRQDGGGPGPPPPPPSGADLDPAADTNLPQPQADGASHGRARLGDVLQGMHTVFALTVINIGVYAFRRSQAQEQPRPSQSSSSQTNQAGPSSTEEALQSLTGAARTSQDSQNSNDSRVGISSSSINQAPENPDRVPRGEVEGEAPGSELVPAFENCAQQREEPEDTEGNYGRANA